MLNRLTGQLYGTEVIFSYFSIDICSLYAYKNKKFSNLGMRLFVNTSTLRQTKKELNTYIFQGHICFIACTYT